MRCTNCGQDLPEGASVCSLCGAPVVPASTPLAGPNPLAQLTFAPPLPGSSGLSTASLILSILSIVALVSVYGIYMVLLTPLISATAGQPSVDDIQHLLGGPEIVAISAFYILSMLLALIGLILGIVGISQEGKRPTRHGKALGIVGLALSIVPLLCCVTSLLIGIVALTGAS